MHGIFWRKPRKLRLPEDSTSVDIGCGPIIRNPLEADRVIGVDFEVNGPETTLTDETFLSVEQGGIFDLQDSSVDAVTCFDFLEHLSREPNAPLGQSFIGIMEQFFRILKPGGDTNGRDSVLSSFGSIPRSHAPEFHNKEHSQILRNRIAG